MIFMRRMMRCFQTSFVFHPLWILATVVMLFSHCAPSPSQSLYTRATLSQAPAPDVSTPLEQRLRSTVSQWTGTPHRLGGTNRSGVDCSGFVQRVYSDLFGIPLPRTTARQVHSGKSIYKKQLQAGDLVFFKPSVRGRHVGIYLGAGQFAHASKTRGVMISGMDEPYWRRTYWTARRLLPDNT